MVIFYQDHPMENVDLAHAKEHLEELMAQAQRGEEVRIIDPIFGRVFLNPETVDTKDEAPFPPRVIGLMKHVSQIPDDRLLAPLTADELACLSGEQSGSQ